MVVDDDDAVRAALAFSLELEGFGVAAFSCAEDLLRLAPLPMCCCFVIDHRLPGVDGVELFVELRSAGAAAPGVLITTDPTPKTRARAGWAGMSIVEKPLLGDALVQTVKVLTCAGSCADACGTGNARRF